MERAKRVFVRTGKAGPEGRSFAGPTSGAMEVAEEERYRQLWKWDWATVRTRLGRRLSPDMPKGTLLKLARIGAWFVLVGLILGVISGGIFIGPFGAYIKKPPRAPMDCEPDDGIILVRPSPGYRAPNFVGRLPDGTVVSLDDCAGLPTVLVFFRTSSAPSIAQMPAVDQLYRERKGQCYVMAIAVFDREDDVGRCGGANDWSVPMIADTRGEIAQAYDITALPTTFIIDAHRVIRDLRIGTMTYAELERALKTSY